jgi:hypothetical protein
MLLLFVLVGCCLSWNPRDVFLEEVIDPQKLGEEIEEMAHFAFDSYRNCEFGFVVFFFSLVFLLQTLVSIKTS